MIIQIIGLPCSGKTYTLEKLKKNFDQSFLKFFDISSNQALPKKYDSAKINIIESAQGLNIETDYTIKLKVTSFLHKKNCKSRNYSLTASDASFIDYYSTPSHFDVYSQKELYKVLSLIINCEIQNDSPRKSSYKNSFKEKFY